MIRWLKCIMIVAALLLTVLLLNPSLILIRPIYDDFCSLQVKSTKELITAVRKCSLSADEIREIWINNAALVWDRLDRASVYSSFPFVPPLALYDELGSDAAGKELGDALNSYSDLLLIAAEVAYRAPDYIPGIGFWSFVRERWFLWAHILMSGPMKTHLPSANSLISPDQRVTKSIPWRIFYTQTILASEDLVTWQDEQIKEHLCSPGDKIAAGTPICSVIHGKRDLFVVEQRDK